jgi:hypothetical protein
VPALIEALRDQDSNVRETATGHRQFGRGLAG